MANPGAIHQLHVALERLSAALESGKLGAVLDAEAPLANALGLLSNLDEATLARDPRTPAALLDLRLSVARCVSRLQGRPGADERGVDAATARLPAMRLAADSRRSRLEDANMAEAITRMNEADIAYRAALSAVSSAERVSLLDYLK
jgi:flagellar hook-associated protein 3 FlgL